MDERPRDLHRETAARLLNKDPEKVTHAEREWAKVYNYGRLYGSGPATLTRIGSRRRLWGNRYKNWLSRTRKKLRFWQTHNLCWADGTVFMTRYTLFKFDGLELIGRRWQTDSPGNVQRFYLSIPPFSLKIHRFRRDDETAHDHPWKFYSLIFWRHYMEEQWHVKDGEAWYTGTVKRRWLSFDHHPPEHVHRVVVEEGKDCWTLCLTVGRERVWGFWEQGEYPRHNVLDRWVDNVTHGDETGRHRVTY